MEILEFGAAQKALSGIGEHLRPTRWLDTRVLGDDES